MVGQWKRERMREEEKRDGGRSLHGGRQMVDTACMADDGWSLHGDQSLHCSPIPLVFSLSLSSGYRVLSEARNQLKVNEYVIGFIELGCLFYG